MLKSLINSIFYEYGTCYKTKARKNRLFGNVQFVLWQKGQQGHKSDYWVNFNKSWWPDFKNSERL